MSMFVFQCKNYFNLKGFISPMNFAILYFLITIVSTVALIALINPEQLELFIMGEITRLDLAPRLGFAVYEFLLLPLYIKRLQSMGWMALQRDIALLVLFVPVMLATFLSDGGYSTASPLIGLLRLMALILTFFMFVTPQKNNPV